MSADNKKVVSNENLAAFAEALAAKVPLKSDIPTKVSDLQNDLGFTDKQGTITSVTLNGTTTSSGGVDLGYLVVQEGGKGLSSNDYTALEKTKLGGIDTGAQVNTIETVKVNGTALVPDANKAVNVQVPTTVAELSDASDYAKTSDLEDYVLITDLEDTEEVLAAAVNDLNNRLDGLVDQYPTENSTNAVSSGGVYEAITENELVTAASLSDLNARVSDLESIGTPDETDPVFSASPAAGITAANITSWNSKVDASEYEEDSEVVASALNDLNTRISDIVNTKIPDIEDGLNSIEDSIYNIPEAPIEIINVGTISFDSNNEATLLSGTYASVNDAYTSGKTVILSGSTGAGLDVYYTLDLFGDGNNFYFTNSYNNQKVILMSSDKLWISGQIVPDETDPVFSASAAAGITASDITNWNSKTSNTGTLTGVKFNNVEATVSNGVASITASIPDVANYFDEVAYDSQTKRINFKHGETVKKYIDATDFIKDGMVDSVEIATPESGDNAGVSCLIVSFNTDAGKEDIEIPLSSIFNPSNYYTKTETDSTFVKKADIDSAPTENSSNPVSSGGVYTTIAQSEYVISTSLNDLNTRVSDVEETLDNIPAAVTESTVSAWGFTKNSGTYSKPSGGIPLTDLADGVITVHLTSDGILASNTSALGVSRIDGNDGATYALSNNTSDGSEDYILATTDQIPTESTVSGWGFTKNSGTYSKPSGGIPASDLTTAVQTSLGKADTALQSFTETDPVFSASAAAGITSSDITNWNSKTSNIGNAKIFYGTCSTTGATAAKIVDCSTFTSADLVNGALIFVTFSETNTATPVTLKMNVNSTGEKSIRKQYSAASVTYLTGGQEIQGNVTYLFTYNGSSWVCMTLDYNTTYPTMTEASAIAGTGTIAGLVSPSVLKTAITTHAPAAITESDVANWGFTKNAGTLTSESDPIFSASVASSITAADISNWNSKTSNTGTLTGVKFNNVDATVSNGVASISAAIPAEVTESTVSGWGFTKNAGTLTGVKVNGSNATVTSGVADIGTVITSHAKHKLTATNETASSTSGTITFVESLTGTTTATDGDLTVTATRKTVTIPAAQVQSDWNATTGMGVILNKPTIPTVNDSTITVQMNGSTVDTFTTNQGSNKTINLGTVITSHQDISGKANVSDLGSLSDLTTAELDTIFVTS